MDPEAHRSSDLSQSRVEVRGIPHLPEPGRYPYFLYAVPKSATCAAFIKESRMDFLEAKQLHRKYGLWGTHHSLPIEITPLATIGFLEVCEKSRLGCFSLQLHKAVILRACDFFDLFAFLVPDQMFFSPLRKTVILSEAPRRS